ncbi:FhaA domain-containing protein [Paradesulfitobacterium ferrireducens]|uniref:FhaA domain-containing protein n=1 Tax=Paradesulfitobacterium ferrireducens TaxID=2816476 RepID=UPI001A8E7A7A|nr:FhaA domain-containing protein [Paradesulfitobacterium ferrireducens]
MSLLERFEEAAERLFTGPFKKNLSRLQPVEIAKELIKAMYKHKQVSVSRVYVPNVYRVFLHSGDWGPLASFGDAFLIELSKYVYKEGSQAGFTFLTKPAIELHADDTVKAREMFIETDFDDSVEVKWEDDRDEEADDSNWPERTNVIHHAVQANLHLAEDQSRNLDYFLEIIEGPDTGKIFPLTEGSFYIGRHTQCELILSDPEVSRRHAALTQSEQGWMLDDLGSTNGTWVNNQRITLNAVAPGDRIQLGQTVMVIKRRTA